MRTEGGSLRAHRPVASLEQRLSYSALVYPGGEMAGLPDGWINNAGRGRSGMAKQMWFILFSDAVT